MYDTFEAYSLLMFAGAIAYQQFREATKGNVVQSLGDGSPMISLVRALLCVDLLFTAPMLLAIGREIVEHSLLSSGLSCSRF